LAQEHRAVLVLHTIADQQEATQYSQASPLTAVVEEVLVTVKHQQQAVLVVVEVLAAKQVQQVT
jgi:hypothetical protein